MKKLSHLHIYTDGGSRGNPGEAASGVYIMDKEGNEIAGIGKRLGIATNNVAEYTAVLIALDWVKEYVETQHIASLHVDFFMDSLLVCSQITGKWQVKNLALGNILVIIREKMNKLNATFSFTHVPREKNKDADRFVNLALDNKI